MASDAGAVAAQVLIFGQTIRPAHMKIIPVAGEALARLLQQNGIAATFSQDPSVLSDLKSYGALVLLDASEGVLDGAQKSSVEAFFKSGRGIMAIHSSISLGKDWPWFRSLVGTSFKSHPPIHLEKVNLQEPVHPSAAEQPLSWSQEDEWYVFSDELDSSSIVTAVVGSHPVSWCREKNESGRFWYTAMGHPESLYVGPSAFTQHLMSGLKWILQK